MKWWQSNFAKVNTMAMFESVDVSNNGTITIDEWMHFWTLVRNHTHTDEEIQEELSALDSHESWVQFNGMPAMKRHGSFPQHHDSPESK